ncbi:histidine kinase [Orenia metallireducens]|jgi:hypothetical protein|uniref:Histidine kinase n=1 Tax=Orenia metallireducens TaxID=1413210 RepID=A0A1C0ACF5_9FIRM|nr:2TM domain-containing protein [Orenia metallireducens]OCL28059.1 histidine kinase [Orenia metallireducens]
MENEELYKQAKERVAQLKVFYKHLFTYILVNSGLAILNLTTSPESLWFYWPMLGWGIGLASHSFSVFGFGKLLGKDWEEKKIRELMNKYKDD